MRPTPLAVLLLCALAALPLAAVPARDDATSDTDTETPMQVHYLEYVSRDVDATCAALAAAHGVTFSEPQLELGGARTATLAGGGRVGVRGPMRETEEPVVRPYLLVDDVEAAVEEAAKAGAEIAMGATEMPGGGRFAIYLIGGNQHGFWER